MAAQKDNVHCAKVLIGACIDVNKASSYGNASSLYLAIRRHHTAVVQLLLDSGATATVNSVAPVQCCNGAACCTHTTPLMLCETADTVKVLLAAGADVHVTNHIGDTCLHSAARHNYKAPVLCLLIKAGADIHAVNSEGKTAAQLAHDRGYTLIEQLLNRAAQQG
jgi:ankyrin repeat protein